ncbi:unnamed protein product [Prorocentrum cordatum]|uniref:Uncharacterized protein n=1 Tax=Prorocentrum cordatum TaxID=2364126 RepID=A0ABN9T5S1_9DINO|nr:unnamed protein product [Polarella glacialis]
MDPQACLEILTQAASQAAKDHQGEAALGGLCCAAAGARAAGLAVGEGPGLRPVFPSDVGFAAEEDEVKPKKFCPPCGEPLPGERTRVNDTEATVGGGQVIDLATGTNETIESELTEVGLLGRFPALAGEPDLGGRPPDLAAGPASLVASVVRLHGARVVVHKAYDAAFQHLLTSKAGGQHALQRMYPFVVSCATARFKVQPWRQRRSPRASGPRRPRWRRRPRRRARRRPWPRRPRWCAGCRASRRRGYSWWPRTTWSRAG